jgi:hypothetical protein
LLAKANREADAEQRTFFQVRARIVFFRYLSVVLETAELQVERPPRLNRIDWDSFSRGACWNFFETRQEDLDRLYRGLRFPDSCILENRVRMDGKEVLMRGLTESNAAIQAKLEEVRSVP